MQQRQMRETAKLQDLERRKIMEQESVQAAGEAQMRSRYRRGTGAESLVSAPGQGGFLLGDRPRDEGAGVARTYTPPPTPGATTGMGAGDRKRSRRPDLYSYGGQLYSSEAQALSLAPSVGFGTPESTGGATTPSVGATPQPLWVGRNRLHTEQSLARMNRRRQ